MSNQEKPAEGGAVDDIYVRPKSHRLSKLQERDARQKRNRLIVGVVAVVGLLMTFFLVSVKPAVKRRAGALVVKGASGSRPQGIKALPFTSVAGTELSLVLPVAKEEVLAIGYHQAYNQRALPLISQLELLAEATTISIPKAISREHPVAFIMAARGRGSALNSSVDVVVNSGTTFNSPVKGKILEVTPYLLYGRSNDVRIDIVADGYPNFKISIVHIDKPLVTAGQRVEAGVTPLASSRALGITSQIDQYLGSTHDHIHIQVNPLENKPVAVNAN